MIDTLSGRVKTDFSNLPLDNNVFLSTRHSEPYLGVPASDNNIVFFDTDGTRRFALPPVFLPGNEIQAQQTNVDAEIYHVFVDNIGSNSQFLADPGIRYNPFLDTMYIDEDLEVGNDLRVGNNIEAVGTITSTSDRSVKRNVRDISPEEALKLLLQLSPVSYNRTDLEGKPSQLGLIAQDVREILPDRVHEDDKGKLSISYIELIPLLISALKALWQQSLAQTLEKT